MRLVRGSCRKHGVDSRLIQAVIQVESNFEPKAVSRKGAQGLMQIMPETQKDLGVKRPFDLHENIEAGVRYLKTQINRFGDHALALAAYNAGPEQVERHQGIPPFSETQAYVRKVLAIYRDLRGG
ncbi:MAG: lytic transglycosylase domain-containing protein [Thermodesulfobacteriota bacterium]|nr:lytic transglycosylase domain-containing protein [Thermodesulfobacteriota bacterium]